MTTREDFYSPLDSGQEISDESRIPAPSSSRARPRPVPTLQAEVPDLLSLEDKRLVATLARTLSAQMPPICLEQSESPVCSIIDLGSSEQLLDQTLGLVEKAGHKARAFALGRSLEDAAEVEASLIYGVDALARWDGANDLFRFASQTLRPGGRLALLDFFMRPDLRAGQLDEVDRDSLAALSRYRWHAPIKSVAQLDWLAGRLDLEPIEDVDLADLLEPQLRVLKKNNSGLKARLGRLLGSLRSEEVPAWSPSAGRQALAHFLDRGLIEVRMQVWQRLSPLPMEVEDSSTVH